MEHLAKALLHALHVVDELAHGFIFGIGVVCGKLIGRVHPNGERLGSTEHHVAGHLAHDPGFREFATTHDEIEIPATKPNMHPRNQQFIFSQHRGGWRKSFQAAIEGVPIHLILISASTEHTDDTVIRVTLHHNHFDGTLSRHPRLRFGKVHAYNNYYDSWGTYGAASCMSGELLSQSNIFEADGDDDAILTIYGDDPDHGFVRSETDWTLNGAQIDENNPGGVFDWQTYYTSATVEAPNDALRTSIEDGAGWRQVPLPPQ